MAGEGTVWDAFPDKIFQVKLQRKLSPELYLLKPLLTGPLNGTGKAGSCPHSEQFYRAVKCKLFSYQHTGWIWHTHNWDSLQHWFKMFCGLSGENTQELRAAPCLNEAFQDPSCGSQRYGHREVLALDEMLIAPLTTQVSLSNSSNSSLFSSKSYVILCIQSQAVLFQCHLHSIHLDLSFKL